MQIFIQPCDVCLFRDGRPFSAGEGHRARSIFPPTPNTIQGTIRSKVLAERCGRYQEYRDGCLNCTQNHDCTIPAEIGTPARGDYGRMHLKGALIAKYEKSVLTAYFPVPADVVQIKDKSNSTADSQLRYLSPLREKIPGKNDLPYSLHSLWSSETKPVEAVQGYWSDRDLTNYLLGKYPNNFITASNLYERESRFGIEVDNSIQAVKEGNLYQTEFIRCQENIGLYVEVQGITTLSSRPDSEVDLIGIGGENRVASYVKIPAIDWSHFQKELIHKIQKSDGFKLYLATPTIWEKGWLPKWIAPENNLCGEYEGINLQLIAAAIAGYQTIGGWDIAENKPKPTYRAVMAGSVYYFETKAAPEKIIEAFHWKNLADENADAQIGYGLTLVGSWNYYKYSEDK